MTIIDFNAIVEEAWKEYDSSRAISNITDISAKVSTNHVYKLDLDRGSSIIAKLSYFGKFEHFMEDHNIINALSNNLPSPYENFLARSLIKGNELFVHRHQSELLDAWVVFYRPVENRNKLPRRQNEEQIKLLGTEFARFHKACDTISNTLPPSSKTLEVDIQDLLDTLETEHGRHEHRMHLDMIRDQCNRFMENTEAIGAMSLDTIPVFVDWNIGNFSVTDDYRLYSRWDYDWFRVSSRMLDFYFISRVVSDVGDRTIFTYNIDPLTEERFILFLKSYHAEFPLNETEIRFLPEVYRFFILNYVIKYGRYFYHEIFANKLQREAYEEHLPSIEENFDPETILKALDI